MPDYAQRSPVIFCASLAIFQSRHVSHILLYRIECFILLVITPYVEYKEEQHRIALPAIEKQALAETGMSPKIVKDKTFLNDSSPSCPKHSLVYIGIYRAI